MFESRNLHLSLLKKSLGFSKNRQCNKVHPEHSRALSVSYSWVHTRVAHPWTLSSSAPCLQKHLHGGIGVELPRLLSLFSSTRMLLFWHMFLSKGFPWCSSMLKVWLALHEVQWLFPGMRNPCAEGEPFRNENGKPVSCNPSAEQNGGCPDGYWCHVGVTYVTTVCCPALQPGELFSIFANCIIYIQLKTRVELNGVAGVIWKIQCGITVDFSRSSPFGVACKKSMRLYWSDESKKKHWEVKFSGSKTKGLENIIKKFFRVHR